MWNMVSWFTSQNSLTVYFYFFFSSNDQMSIEHVFKILNAIEGLHKH